MSEIFGRNLKFLRERKGLEQIELAQLLGRKSPSTISEWEKGKYTPKAGTLSDIAKIFNVSLQDLMQKDLTEPSNLIELSPRTVRIPILGRISCGDPIDAVENIEGYMWKRPEDVRGGKHYGLIAEGMSMYPTIPHGAKITIKEQPEAENGQIVAALVNGDTQVTLKRFRRQGNTILLTPDNPEYETIIVDKDHPAHIIGIVKSYEVEF